MPDPDAQTDTELLESWQAGDVGAGNELIGRHYGAIGRFFRSKVGDDYDDLVQRTFKGCVEGNSRFRAEGSFRAYLFGIARNVLRNSLTERTRHAHVDPATSSVVELGLPGVETVAGSRREQKIVYEAVRRLPLEDQTLIEWFYWESLNSAEIAEALGIPRGTVRSRLRLARERLQGHIEQLARTPAEVQSSVDGLERWMTQMRAQLG